jgi:hypothetical protein
MTPDGLTELARRLRAHADGIRNPAAKSIMGVDMTAASEVIEGIVMLHAEIHAGEQTNVVQGVLRLIGATRITLDLPTFEAMALAQFLKRLGFEDVARFAAVAVTYDDVVNGRPRGAVPLRHRSALEKIALSVGVR